VSLAAALPISQRVIRVPAKPAVRARVLIVSPAAERARHMRAVLLRGHFAATVVPDGKIAAALAAHHDTDVLLIDLDDPEFDGLSLCRDLRDAGVTIPILMLDPGGDLEDLLDGYEAGTDAYLHGKVEHRDLFDRIEQLCGLPRLRWR
jgi:DNA-binding response OmpR family regulator